MGRDREREMGERGGKRQRERGIEGRGGDIGERK